ncbi:exonuclease SbcCD subunit D [Aquifex aeolicus]|uniref:Nuclease SbcCD subunit D n=1 Tax=Aquifex aeolicus (strain VF5) TaxID=224324 RepID=O67727_AQUAE|nr:exonuclease SbcCD subunit D [Aquifex aeolicus]AAC07689.1 ATP-dependent dsDNA exonuclease [Aquifex aeolicus VF5]
MRLIHLSDIHAGKNLGRVSRNEDVVYALNQVVDFCKENKPDLVLVAGDVFDKANPDNEAKEIIFDFFLKLHSLNIPSVVISGNHDSYEFMKSLKKLLQVIDVYVVPKPNLEECVLDVKGLKIACLPYPSERVLTRAGEDSKLSYAVLVEKAIKYLYEKVKDAPLKVLLSHLFIAGSKYTRTEREATITDYYAVEPSAIPEGFDYVALGHVHRYQRIEKAPTHVYYTGSLFQLDFSEAGQEKFFNFVELKEGEPPHVEAIKLSLKNPLHTFEINQENYAKELEKIKDVQGYIKVHLIVKDKTKMHLVAEKVKEALGEKLIKLELLTPEEAIKKRLEEEREIQKLNLLDLYRDYFKESYGREVPQEIIKTVSQLLEQVHES